MEDNTQELAELRGFIFRKLAGIDGFMPNTPRDEPVLPHILNVSFDGVGGHALAHLLSERYGVMVSAGAACTSGEHKPSHVLMAMYNDPLRAAGGIRISLSHENTADECKEAVKAIAECVKTLREVG